MSDEIRKAISGMQKNVNAEIFWATVVSVDKTKETCTIKFVGSELEIEDVLLSLNNGGVCEIPEVGSLVIVGSIEGLKSDCFVIWEEKIESIKIRYADKVIFNSESLGGFVKINELLKSLNNIEKAYNDLLNEFKSHNHIHDYGPTKGLLIPVTLQDLSETQISSIENKKIQHGE
jgi:phage gp45-like